MSSSGKAVTTLRPACARPEAFPPPALIFKRLRLSLLLFGVVCGCSRNSPDAATRGGKGTAIVPVNVARAESRDVPIELHEIGNVEAFSTVTIRSQLTGQIVQVPFQEGQEVKSNDVLFKIDPRPWEGALRHAQADLMHDQAQLASAQLEFDRQKKLLESKISSRDAYDIAEAAFHALEGTVLADQSAISNATLNVEFTSIRSPIDGRTGNLLVKAGNVVKAPDDRLVTVNQVHPIYVTFSVPEQDLPEIRRRLKLAPLSVEARALGDNPEPARGELSFMDNAVDATTGRIQLKATFSNTNDLLWPGQFVQATLTLGVLNGATVVPSHALQSSQNGDFVFVVNADNTVSKRLVVAGSAHGESLIIEKGVKPGETVVIDGQLRLAEGSKISIATPQTAGSASGASPEHGATP
jgi:multidrug efflux system membrane fusion protein